MADNRKYTGGVPKAVGIEMQTNKPWDERDIVKTREGLKTLENVFDGIDVKVEDESYAKYRFLGGDQTDLDNWIKVGGVETDPVFRSSIAFRIDDGDIRNWNNKEDDLGKPPIDGYVLASTMFGVRSWVRMDGGSGGTMHHSELMGLSSDDHHQYLLTNGSRPMAGTLDMASNTIGNLHNGTQVTDAATVGQTSTMVNDLRDETEFALQGKAETVHTHSSNDISDLQDLLDDKADVIHTHEIDDVNGLQVELDGKAPTTHTHQISQINNLQSELDNKYSESEFINSSTGVSDSGKPIVLNGQGQIDPSMIDASTFYYVGIFDPSGGTEYPDTTGESHGAFWVVQGLSAPYTFTGGDLVGLEIDNGDFMVWGTGGWSIMRGEMNPMLYYKLDGTQAITGPFAGGGQVITDIADGVQVTDGATLGQVSSMDQDVRNEFEANDQTLHTMITDHTGDTNNPHDVSYVELLDVPSSFPPASHTHVIGDTTDLQSQLNGKEPHLGQPSNDGYVLSSTSAGVRSWIEMTGGSGGDFTEIYPGIDSNFYEYDGGNSTTDVVELPNMFTVGFLLSEPNDFSGYYVQKEYEISTGYFKYLAVIKVVKKGEDFTFDTEYTVGNSDSGDGRVDILYYGEPNATVGFIVDKFDETDLRIEWEFYRSIKNPPTQVEYGDGILAFPGETGQYMFGTYLRGHTICFGGTTIAEADLGVNITGSSVSSDSTRRLDSYSASSPSNDSNEEVLMFETGAIDGLVDSVVNTGIASTTAMKGMLVEGGGGIAYFHDTAIPPNKRLRSFYSDMLGDGAASNNWAMAGIIATYPEEGGSATKVLNEQGDFIEMAVLNTMLLSRIADLEARLDAAGL